MPGIITEIANVRETVPLILQEVQTTTALIQQILAEVGAVRKEIPGILSETKAIRDDIPGIQEKTEKLLADFDKISRTAGRNAALGATEGVLSAPVTLPLHMIQKGIERLLPNKKSEKVQAKDSIEK